MLVESEGKCALIIAHLANPAPQLIVGIIKEYFVEASESR